MRRAITFGNNVEIPSEVAGYLAALRLEYL
jgi:hypothetical protein